MRKSIVTYPTAKVDLNKRTPLFCQVKDWNDVQHSKQLNNEYSIKRVKFSFATPPCRICGRDDHTMLMEDFGIDGRSVFKYTCPVALLHENWEEARSLPNYSDKYSICPIKFIQHNAYSIPEFNRAFCAYRGFGAGRWVHSDIIDKLQQDVYNLYEEYLELTSQFNKTTVDKPPICCDLDGILTDFNLAATNLFLHSTSIEEIPPRELWKPSRKLKTFFLNTETRRLDGFWY